MNEWVGGIDGGGREGGRYFALFSEFFLRKGFLLLGLFDYH